MRRRGLVFTAAAIALGFAIVARTRCGGPRPASSAVLPEASVERAGPPDATPVPQERRDRAPLGEQPAAAASAPEPSGLGLVLRDAEALAARMDPAARPTAAEVADFLCALMRVLDADVDPRALRRAGITLAVEPEWLRATIPVRAGADGERIASAVLVLEILMPPGDTTLDLRRILVPARALAGDPLLAGEIPATSGIEIDYGEWRGGPWTWEIRDGWFEASAPDSLSFVDRADELLEPAGADRACVDADALRAWAAALPWTGAVPPEALDDPVLARLYRAAEELAAELHPAATPVLAVVQELLCALADASIPERARDLAAAEVQVDATEDDLRVRVPIRGFPAGFRAAFLVLSIRDLADGGEIVVWRELVPELARPHDPSAGDPRFDGTEPVSAWLALDLAAGELSVGDLRLESRDPGDWRRAGARAELDRLPVVLGGGCADAAAWRARAQSLRRASAAGR